MTYRLSHACCRACDVFFNANHRQCPRCHSRLNIVPPICPDTPQTKIGASKRAKWIAHSSDQEEAT